MQNQQQISVAPWCIYRQISSGYQICIARLKTRGEAESHLKLFKSHLPEAVLTLAFTTEETTPIR